MSMHIIEHYDEHDPLYHSMQTGSLLEGVTSVPTYREILTNYNESGLPNFVNSCYQPKCQTKERLIDRQFTPQMQNVHVYTEDTQGSENFDYIDFKNNLHQLNDEISENLQNLKEDMLHHTYNANRQSPRCVYEEHYVYDMYLDGTTILRKEREDSESSWTGPIITELTDEEQELNPQKIQKTQDEQSPHSSYSSLSSCTFNDACVDELYDKIKHTNSIPSSLNNIQNQTVREQVCQEKTFNSNRDEQEVCQQKTFNSDRNEQQVCQEKQFDIPIEYSIERDQFSNLIYVNSPSLNQNNLTRSAKVVTLPHQKYNKIVSKSFAMLKKKPIIVDSYPAIIHPNWHNERLRMTSINRYDIEKPVYSHTPSETFRRHGKVYPDYFYSKFAERNKLHEVDFNDIPAASIFSKNHLMHDKHNCVPINILKKKTKLLTCAPQDTNATIENHKITNQFSIQHIRNNNHGIKKNFCGMVQSNPTTSCNMTQCLHQPNMNGVHRMQNVICIGQNSTHQEHIKIQTSYHNNFQIQKTCQNSDLHPQQRNQTYNGLKNNEILRKQSDNLDRNITNQDYYVPKNDFEQLPARQLLSNVTNLKEISMNDQLCFEF